MAMEYWAMQYMNYARVVSPQALAEKIKANVQNSPEKYSNDL